MLECFLQCFYTPLSAGSVFLNLRRSVSSCFFQSPRNNLLLLVNQGEACEGAAFLFSWSSLGRPCAAESQAGAFLPFLPSPSLPAKL